MTAPIRAASGAALGLAASLVLACASSSGTRQNVAPAQGASPARGEPITLLTGAEAAQIALLEDARSTGGGALLAHLHDARPEIRTRAAQALGRIALADAGAEVTTALCRRLEDQESRVRAAAAFALGLRADPESAGVLRSYLNDPDPLVRARVVEAASKLPDQPELRAAIREAMLDPDPRVQIEAVVATTRWSSEDPDAAEVDSALLGVLRPLRNARREAGEPRDEVVWYALFALQRRTSEIGRGPFLEHADSADPLARLFSVRGLARLQPDDSSTAALVRALDDDDWRVAYEAAAGLEGRGGARCAEALVDAARHPSAHVRARVAVSLGHVDEGAGGVDLALGSLASDRSDSVRAGALEGRAARRAPDDAARLVESALHDDSFVVRAAAVRAAAALESRLAVPLLAALAGDRDALVAGAALETLAEHPTPAARELLRTRLGDPDAGARLAAVLALAELAAADEVAPLVRALDTADGENADEIAAGALRALGQAGGDEARDAIARARAHASPYVRRVADAVLRERFAGYEPPPVTVPERAADPVPLPGREIELWTHQPLVEIVTERGSLVFELLPAVAPVHVHNFLALAARDHYDGLRFHRVVPNFVVQGGDHRGDGNGATTWRGGSLRHEIGPLEFGRGALGMPRAEDLDGGGSQIFVTHRPTPHLDGRYTLFGVLREGGDVLDAIEMGDRILDVRPALRPNARP